MSTRASRSCCCPDGWHPRVEAHGVRFAAEAFPDLEYEPGGALVIEPVKQAWDPDRVARRAVRVVLDRRIDTTDGDDLEIDAPTLCLHGDAPNAVETARTVRQALESAGVTVTALRISRTQSRRWFRQTGIARRLIAVAAAAVALLLLVLVLFVATLMGALGRRPRAGRERKRATRHLLSRWPTSRATTCSGSARRRPGLPRAE